MRRLLVASAVIGALLWASLGAAILAAATGAPPAASSPISVPGIPSEFITAYVEAAKRFDLGADGWSYLAGIGKVESDHGRSTAIGVHSGQNAYGCCAGPMQIHNGFGSGGGTWGAYKIDGDGDGRTDIYDAADAVATAANYLRASGAPSDWHAAVFAYNHAGWYVDEVFRQAATYRAKATIAAPDATGAPTTLAPADGAWLGDVPGWPGERCDRRIIADVLMLIARFNLRLNDCFGGGPHDTNGEHPLGLAADLAPADGDWDRTLLLARTYGWDSSCASTGCGGRGPFRVVLYNGFPGHGDPAHTSQPHIHLSWMHAPAAPFTPARWVRVLTPIGTAP